MLAAILRKSKRLTVAGLALAGILSLLMRFLATLKVALVLATVALLASLLPTRRAGKADLVTALRPD